MTASTPTTPTGWQLAGSHPADYETGLDRSVFHSGSAGAYLKHRRPRPGGFATLMQTFKADRYLGQRLQMIAYVRSAQVKNWVGLWLRVDDTGGHSLSFDNMQDRPISGSSDWQSYAIILDVPAQAARIAFGFLLHSSGQVWADDFSFESLGPALGRSPALPDTPSNLDFEE